MIDLTQQRCPVCQQTRSELIHATTYPEHHYPGTFSLRRCGGCGLLFNSPRLDGAELSRLYGRNYYFFLRDDAREFDRIVAMYQRTIGLIEPELLDKRSIDIGCGRGYFPAVLKQLGWDASGIEISPDASQYARSKLGLDVFTGTVEDYASSPQAKQFPLVTGIDVIEHVPAPDGFIAAAARLVAPGGRLIIDTPNAAAHNIAAKGISWKGFNPFHVYLFSIDMLATMLGRHGMTIERSFSYGNARTPRGLRDRTIAGLKRVGMLWPVASVYFGMKKLTISNAAPEPHVAKAVSRIKAEPPYTGTPDSWAPLAQSKTGDNIVVVARKT